MTHIRAMADLFASGWTGDANNASVLLRIPARAARESIQRLSREGVIVQFGVGANNARLWAKGSGELPPAPPPVSHKPAATRFVWTKARGKSMPGVPMHKRALALRGDLAEAWWPIGEAV